MESQFACVCVLQLESSESRSGSSLSLKQLQIPHRPNPDANSQSPSHSAGNKVQRSISATNSKGRRYSTGGENGGKGMSPSLAICLRIQEHSLSVCQLLCHDSNYSNKKYLAVSEK